MQIAVPVSERLKTGTLVNHQLVEKSIVKLIKGITSKSDCLQLLQIFYGFFSAVEIQMLPWIPFLNLPDIDSRRKAVLLENDILSLGGSIMLENAYSVLPEMINKYQAFGALYVTEGSTLGGVHIAAMIQKRLQNMDHSLTFFQGYGTETMKKWELFKKVMDALPTGNKDHFQILQAADQTFASFNQWIDQNTSTG